MKLKILFILLIIQTFVSAQDKEKYNIFEIGVGAGFQFKPPYGEEGDFSKLQSNFITMLDFAINFRNSRTIFYGVGLSYRGRTVYQDKNPVEGLIFIRQKFFLTEKINLFLQQGFTVATLTENAREICTLSLDVGVERQFEKYSLYLRNSYRFSIVSLYNKSFITIGVRYRL